jgi:cellulose synthase/poly-beta-1,6-N-acetylglucosamine synthase-like glycosyltransferase
MTTISIIFLIILILHFLLGVISLRRYPQQSTTTKLSFSVVVVAHNEEKMLNPLLESLLVLNYPLKQAEIILVDDNSSDHTWDLISSFANQHSHIKAIKSNLKYSDYKGKKAGLQSALDIANNEILVFTDADATVPTNWLESYNKYFTDHTGLVIGYIRGENISYMKRYKRIISSGIFAAFSGIGYPFSCSGGNLAIRKTALTKVGGYSSIKDFPSGDDKQMLNLIKKTGCLVAYNSALKVIERARALTSDQVYQQNIRHYGKFSLSSPIYQIGFILIICYYLSVPVLSIFKPSLLLLFWLSNLSFYLFSCYKHKESFKVEDLFLTVIYPYYMLYFSILGTFSEVKWKK